MDKTLIFPLIAQVFLTLGIGVLALKERVKSVRKGQVPLTYFKHNRGKAPEKMMRYGDNYLNQFELPILFYLFVVMVILTERANDFYLVLSWIFVVSRYLHAYIHIGSNDIPKRLSTFMIGAVVMIVMWLKFLIEILIS